MQYKDEQIFNGLRSCASVNELRAYYEKEFENVTDKKGFAQLKEELKYELSKNEDDYERLIVERRIEARQNIGTLNRIGG